MGNNQAVIHNQSKQGLVYILHNEKIQEKEALVIRDSVIQNGLTQGPFKHGAIQNKEIQRAIAIGLVKPGRITNFRLKQEDQQKNKSMFMSIVSAENDFFAMISREITNFKEIKFQVKKDLKVHKMTQAQSITLKNIVEGQAIGEEKACVACKREDIKSQLMGYDSDMPCKLCCKKSSYFWVCKQYPLLHYFCETCFSDKKQIKLLQEIYGGQTMEQEAPCTACKQKSQLMAYYSPMTCKGCEGRFEYVWVCKQFPTRHFFCQTCFEKKIIGSINSPTVNDKKQQEFKKHVQQYGQSSGLTTWYFDGQEIRSLKNQLALKEGIYTIGQYSFVTDQKNQKNLLGRGGFGKVFKGYSSNPQLPEIAVKVMMIEKKQQLQLCRKETLRQKLVESEGVVKIYMSKEYPIGEKSYFILACQLMEGELKVPENGYSPEEALDKIKSLVRSYRKLYQTGMAHRDLKPQNILVSKEKELKISDFGSAKDIAGKKQRSVGLTKDYASPQLSRLHDHTNKCDVYAIGCIFFQFLTGVTPKIAGCAGSFNKIDMQKIKKVLSNKIGITPLILDFLEGCLKEKETVEITTKDGKKCEDPKQSRLSWEGVYLHPIFKKDLVSIPKRIAGRYILLTIKTYGQVNSVDVIDLLEKEKLQSKLISKEKLINLFHAHKINIPSEDVDKLLVLMGRQKDFDLTQLVRNIKGIDEKQYSKYSVQQSRAFMRLFNNTDEFMKQLKNETYKQRKSLQLRKTDFTMFPILPQMLNLTTLWITQCQIQVLEARLNTPLLEKLNMPECQIQRIITIRGCPNLTYLNLMSNKLKQIDGLQMIHKLCRLNLKDNRLNRISNIAHLKKLRIIDLCDNKIAVIQGLSGCTSLQEILLSDNRIKQLSQELLEMKQAPIEHLSLDQNRIQETTKNKKILFDFKEQHPDVRVILNQRGTKHEQIFDKFFETKLFTNGNYKLINFKDKSKCIEAISGTVSLNKENKEPHQIWHLKIFEEDEYCILAQDQKSILWALKDCTISSYPYEEEQDDHKENSQCRWVFDLIGNQDGQPYYQIINVFWKWRIRALDNGKITTCKKYEEVKDGSDRWYIKPL